MKFVNKAKKIIREMHLLVRLCWHIQKKPMIHIRDEVIIYNTAIESDNLGDEIIVKALKDYLQSIGKNCSYHEVATHTVPSKEEIFRLKSARIVIVCGTNFLWPQMEFVSNWRFTEDMIEIPRILLVGVGWAGYNMITPYTRLFLKKILNNGFIHSVRDEYTKTQLERIGIINVLNTNCITMWNLQDKVHSIPSKKADTVIFSLTSHRKLLEYDCLMISILRKNYDKLIFWPQGNHDLEYLKGIDDLHEVEIIPRSLEAFENYLISGDVDYIGTRLHGGIFALNHSVRTIIIGIDNRAIEIAKDTGIPVVCYENIAEKWKRK